jgi:hypothetical protein
MFEKRDDRDQGMPGRNGQMAELETARSAAESSCGEKPIAPKKSEEEHISLFWRVFGGTILSIAALISMTLYNNLTSSIADLRADLSREREARAELVKKDDFNTRLTAQADRLRGIETVKIELEGLKEKVGSNAVALDGAKRDTAAAIEGMKRDTAVTIEAVKKDAAASADAQKKDSAAVEVLKDRVALIEGVRKDIAGLDALKERMTAVVTALKAVREDVGKLSSDVERNKAADMERKASRDAQQKQIDEALKEMQKGLQDCREKLARLEGGKPGSGEPSPAPRPIARPTPPTTPGDVKPAGGSSKPAPEPMPPAPDGT